LAIPNNYKNRVFSGDIEANGLLETVDKVWCIVTEDIESEEMYTFHDYPELCGQEVVDPHDNITYTIPERTGSLVEGVRFWYLAGRNGSKLAVHNCAGYDKLLVEKFWPKCVIPDEAWDDTLIWSKIQWFERGTPKGAKGVHGLQAWGCRFGINKPDIVDWTVMDAFMLHRCIEDVKIQTKTYNYLLKERKAVKSKLNIDFTEGYQLEFKVRQEDTWQELNGANIDKPACEDCIVELDKLSSELRNEIEPQLPQHVKAKTQKVSLSELGELLGLKRKLVDETERVVVKGEWVEKVKKPYHKPSVNYTSRKKLLQYSGEHVVYGKTLTYEKRAQLSTWIKETFPDTKQKDWNIKKVEIEYEVLNHHTVNHFECDPTDTEYVCGPHTRVEWLDTKMSQHDKVKQFLLKLGWVPDEWNYKKDPIKGGLMKDDDRKPIPTSPKLTESSYETLPPGLGMQIAEYNTYMHRRRFLANPEDDEKGILNMLREDGRLSCGLNNFATATGRYIQSKWVNAPGEGALYGEKIRSLLIPSPGWELVGADMKSAQLSIAAYYANNLEYYNAVADGQEEIELPDGTKKYLGESGHCVNARAFTLVSDAEWKEAVRTQDSVLLKSIMLRRKKSKGGSFSTIFGASGRKVAQTLGIPESLGEAKKNAFLKNIGLDRVIEILKMMTTANARAGGGYIELPFGYHVWSNQQHKYFNYLDQGTEAACQKFATHYFEDQLKERKLDSQAMRVLNIHDEYLVDCHPDISKEVGKLMCESYEVASYECWEWHKKNSKWFTGDDLPTFMFNLDGGCKISANNYLETH